MDVPRDWIKEDRVTVKELSRPRTQRRNNSSEDLCFERREVERLRRRIKVRVFLF